VFQGEAFDGFIVGVFQVQAALATILGQSIAPRHAIAVFDGGEEVYRRAKMRIGNSADIMFRN
jgi:sensor domain CHASE-containing protein